MNCAAFDFEEDIMDWYFVPGLDMSLNYVDTNGTAYLFNRTAYHASEAYTQKCGGFQKCQCSPTRLIASYYNSNLDITFNSTATYYFDPILTMFHDSVRYNLNIDMANDYIFSQDTAYAVIPIDTFNIFGNTYTDVFEIKGANESFKFWLKKNNGMLAFEKNSIRYHIN
jgi:hypothetical protein